MIKRRNLDEEVYEILMMMIMDNRFTMGQKISIEDIENEIGVSRTPILAALKQLTYEGLLESRPRNGFFAPQFSDEDYDEIIEVINLITMEAFRKIVANDDKKYIASLRDCAMASSEAFLSGGRKAYMEADKRFHVAIVDYLNNRRITEYFTHMFNQICFIYQLSVSHENKDDSLRPESHFIFCDLLDKGDLNLLDKHLREDFSKTLMYC